MGTTRTIQMAMATIPTTMLLEVMKEAVRILLFFQADKRICYHTQIKDQATRKFRSIKTSQETSRLKSHKLRTET
jgi:hypothetical protein